MGQNGAPLLMKIILSDVNNMIGDVDKITDESENNNNPNDYNFHFHNN
jgi:hypothetical protein